ncbi:MAG: ABC transporter permease [Chloroflexi bacterium]|nr:ABC transporter permease [Chloroflexota bacterium]
MKQLRKYWAIFVVQLLNSLAYPAELLWRSLAILLFMLVFTFLWRATYGSNQSMAGLTLNDTIWYLMLAETIELSRPRFARTIAEAVKDGSVAYLLNKPYDFILYQLAASGGDSVFRILLNALLGGTLVWALVGPPPGLPGWLLAFAAMLGAWLINFCLTALIGLLAFVTEDVAPFEWIYQKMIFILGGMLIPIDFYPEWLQDLARALPFSHLMYGPAKLFVRPEWGAFLELLAWQAAWVALLGGTLAISYQLGIRRLAINGG